MFSMFKTKMNDKTTEFVQKIGEYYKPFDTVGKLNESIKNKPLKNMVNLGLFSAGSVFFLFSLYTLYKVYTTGYGILMDTRLYLIAMILMFMSDLVAVVVEGIDIRDKIKNDIKVKYSNYISISLSFIIGTVTGYMIYKSWNDYRSGMEKIAPDIILITIMKMILAAVITYRSGEVLWENLVKPTAEITKNHIIPNKTQESNDYPIKII